MLYYRVPRLLDALALARGDGRYARLLKSLARVELLILDDWGLAPLTSQQGRDLLEIVDDRHGRASTIVTSQLPVDHWHEVIADPTIADAVSAKLKCPLSPQRENVPFWAGRHSVWAEAGHLGRALGIDCRGSGFAPRSAPV